MVKGADSEQAARGRLRTPDYSDARTLLAKEQTKRIKQIRLEAERKLIPADEVHRFLVGMGQGLNVRMRGIEKRLRAAYPGLEPEVYEFVRKAHEDALGLVSDDVLKSAGG
jgi:hypothetical protein